MYELIHKPTFTNQLLGLQPRVMSQVLGKVELLRDDPRPQGDLKKKLHGYDGGVYRLRSGDFRIVYSYGEGWVVLLGVDDRKDVYRGTRLVAERPAVDLAQVLLFFGGAQEAGFEGILREPSQLDLGEAQGLLSLDVIIERVAAEIGGIV